MRYYPLNETTAREAHRANSMMEYRSDEPSYRAEVDEVYKLADMAAERDGARADEAYALADRFASKYAQWLDRGYAIESMCPSILISGGSNFPVRKKERQNRARDKHYAELSKITAIKGKIAKIGTAQETIRASDSNAEERLAAKIEKMERNHESMKKANADARKDGKETPYPAWALSNNLQNIAATKKRLKSITDKKAGGTSLRKAVFMGEDIVVIENTEIMRLQLVFDGKPDEDVRSALKSNGFKWSNKNVAWQRQLTDNALRALRRMID